MKISEQLGIDALLLKEAYPYDTRVLAVVENLWQAVKGVEHLEEMQELALQGMREYDPTAVTRAALAGMELESREQESRAPTTPDHRPAPGSFDYFMQFGEEKRYGKQ